MNTKQSTVTKQLSVIHRPDKSIELCLSNGVPIAVVNYRNLAWAQNIALAVNSRQRMIDAMEALVECPDYQHIQTHEMETVRQALAAAKGGMR